MKNHSIKIVVVVMALASAGCAAFNIGKAPEPKRQTLSLNGMWQVEESNAADTMPTSFSRTVPVPGLVDLAGPEAFEKVGYETDYKRYFWYRKTFTLPDDIPAVALLKIHKAKYTTKVFLNGAVVGEQPFNFTPGYFDLKPFLKATGENELVVRVSTYDNCPKNQMDGHDFEKKRYFPGIYDDVDLILAGPEFIDNVQIAPQIEQHQIRVVTEIRNTDEPVRVAYRVVEYASGKVVKSGTATSNDFTVQIPNVRLWSPEDPFLYNLEVETATDQVTTRFGMREFHFDSKTGKAYLNGKPYYMRGTNICVFRFFEDPSRALLPWDENWVRQLHRKCKSMHWNSIRYTIGFPSEMWYRIADEEGFLIQDEAPIWYGKWNQIEKMGKDLTQLHVEYEQWMRERWNHPCVVIWDAQNETRTEHTGAAIKKVRHLDLSNRPWDNGWSEPVTENDSQEAHPYLYHKFHKKDAELPEEGLLKYALSPVRIPDNGPSEVSPSESGEKYVNPYIVNEYAWLWINRNGTPTKLTEHLYPKAFGELSAQELYTVYARHLSMKTEYWRAHRKCAAVMQFCALGYSRPNEPKGETSDNFIDIENLVFEPTFERYCITPGGLRRCDRGLI